MAGRPRPGAPRGAWRTAPAASLKDPQRQPPQLVGAGRAANGARAEVARPQSLVVAAGADAGRQNGGSGIDRSGPLPARNAPSKPPPPFSLSRFSTQFYSPLIPS